jgi:hypothetical protein
MLKKLIAVVLTVSGLAFAQTASDERTARQYYNEVWAASGLNPLVTTVCFRPGEPDVFEVIGFTKDFPETMKAKGMKPDPVVSNKPRENLLLSHTYRHGVKAAENLLAHDELDSNSWFDDYTSKGHKFRLVITLSPAGRYRRAVYVDTNILPAAETSGKCEPIL